MALTLYTSGDLVAQKQVFDKCGRVMESKDGNCLIGIDGQLITVPESELILISARNIPNLRLIAEKVWQAQSAIAFDRNLGHAIMGYLGAGSVVSRAFADYILKISPALLHQCLAEIAQVDCGIETSVERVLGLNFALISGKS